MLSAQRCNQTDECKRINMHKNRKVNDSSDGKGRQV